MDYIKNNKTAWEHAFEHRDGSYAKDLVTLLKTSSNPFFHDDFYALIKAHDLTHKTIGQFCANNGRELCQIAHQFDIASATGFELARNMVDYANHVAQAMQVPANFIETDVLTIKPEYDNHFDYGLITVGAACWFENVHAFFNKVARTLKAGATLFIHEAHPAANMLGAKGEAAYDPLNPKKLLYNYFEKKVWQEHSMGYMSKTVDEANTFTSFSHNLSDFLSALIDNGFTIKHFKEYDYCIGNMFDAISHEGIPLSMIIVATKNGTAH